MGAHRQSLYIRGLGENFPHNAHEAVVVDCEILRIIRANARVYVFGAEPPIAYISRQDIGKSFESPTIAEPQYHCRRTTRLISCLTSRSVGAGPESSAVPLGNRNSAHTPRVSNAQFFMQKSRPHTRRFALCPSWYRHVSFRVVMNFAIGNLGISPMAYLT